MGVVSLLQIPTISQPIPKPPAMVCDPTGSTPHPRQHRVDKYSMHPRRMIAVSQIDAGTILGTCASPDLVPSLHLLFLFHRSKPPSSHLLNPPFSCSKFKRAGQKFFSLGCPRLSTLNSALGLRERSGFAEKDILPHLETPVYPLIVRHISRLKIPSQWTSSILIPTVLKNLSQADLPFNDRARPLPATPPNHPTADRAKLFALPDAEPLPRLFKLPPPTTTNTTSTTTVIRAVGAFPVCALQLPWTVPSPIHLPPTASVRPRRESAFTLASSLVATR